MDSQLPGQFFIVSGAKEWSLLDVSTGALRPLPRLPEHVWPAALADGRVLIAEGRSRIGEGRVGIVGPDGAFEVVIGQRVE